MLFPSLDLARRLEGCESTCSTAFAEAAAALYPGVQILRCAGGAGLIYGASDPLNAVKGVGLSGLVDVAEWDALETAFRVSGSPVVIDLCPFVDEAFIAMLSSRGYTIGAFETVNFMDLTEPAKHTAKPGGVSIEIVDARDEPRVHVWSRTIGVGFANGEEPMKFAVDFAKVRIELGRRHRAGVVKTMNLMFLATVDGAPVGGAGLSMHGDVAHFAGAAVLPQFRRRGIQTALTNARLEAARARGCTLAKFDVHAGSTSHHNALRAGFSVAYTRPQLVRAWQ